MATIDATAVHFMYDFVRNMRERRRLNPATDMECPAPIEVVLANPSMQIVRRMEQADLVNYIRAPFSLVFTLAAATSHWVYVSCSTAMFLSLFTLFINVEP